MPVVKPAPIDYIPDCTGNMGNWKERHVSAMNHPRGAEIPIVELIRAWLNYSYTHEARYSSQIGDDGVLGDHWEQIGKALRGMLNGHCGRLDCGTLDHIILSNLLAQGF